MFQTTTNRSAANQTLSLITTNLESTNLPTHSTNKDSTNNLHRSTSRPVRQASAQHHPRSVTQLPHQMDLSTNLQLQSILLFRPTFNLHRLQVLSTVQEDPEVLEVVTGHPSTNAEVDSINVVEAIRSMEAVRSISEEAETLVRTRVDLSTAFDRVIL
uniref:Uncharacterized protein n=1 Tax=Cacopsylla melanoneura TaxID=428564 RepID=A0A8D8V0K0_9HEMI